MSIGAGWLDWDLNRRRWAAARMRHTINVLRIARSAFLQHSDARRLLVSKDPSRVLVAERTAFGEIKIARGFRKVLGRERKSDSDASRKSLG